MTTRVRPTIARIGAQPSPPEAVADDRDPRLALGRGFGGGEAAADRHRHAEQVEEVGGDDERHDRHRVIAVAPVDRDLDVVAGEAGQRAALVELAPVPIGDVAAVRDADVDELLRARARTAARSSSSLARPKISVLAPTPTPIDAVAASDEQRLPRQSDRSAVAQVLGEVLHERDAPGVATLRPRSRVTGPKARRAASARGLRRHPAGDVLARLLFEVQGNLPRELGVGAMPAEERAQPQEEAIDGIAS